MQEQHTIRIQLLKKGTDLVQSEIAKIEKTLIVNESAIVKTYLRMADLLKTINLSPVSNPDYLFVTGHHLVANITLGVKAGDLAPFKIRLNGSTEEIDCKEGFGLLAGEITGFQVSTTIEENISISVYVAG
jgi:hypothetical protein